MAKNIKRPAESFTYVLIGDRDLPPEQQTGFVLRPMTMTEYAAAHDDLIRTLVDRDGNRTLLTRTRQRGIGVAIAHIVEVRNFPVGSAQPWPKDPADRERYLEQMAYNDVQEIAGEVFRRGEVGTDEKNSSPPERTSASGAISGDRTSTTAPSALSSPG